jgi:hypothetical protein
MFLLFGWFGKSTQDHPTLFLMGFESADAFADSDLSGGQSSMSLQRTQPFLYFGDPACTLLALWAELLQDLLEHTLHKLMVFQHHAFAEMPHSQAQ